jgi:hypothetical protein
MMRTRRISVGAFLGAGFASLFLMAPISTVAQSSSTAPTEQQGATGQQGQQPHKNLYHHTHQGMKSGTQPQGQQ